MTQAGEHTWDLAVHYHSCPSCGYIIESREGYRYLLGKWIKDITCDRCGNKFRLTRKNKPSFGPFFGKPQPPEIDWE